MAYQQKHTILTLVLGVIACTVANITWAKRYPDDPFAWQHKPMDAKEIGTTAGQMQFSVLGTTVISSSNDDPYLGGKMGSDYMLNEYGALRFYVAQDLFEPNGGSIEHRFTSFRFGSSWHLNPYRAVDIGSFIDAGVLVVDFIKGKSGDKAPEVSLGGFMMYHIDSALFIRAEMERAWCNVEIDGIDTKQHRTALSLGLGMAF